MALFFSVLQWHLSEKREAKRSLRDAFNDTVSRPILSSIDRLEDICQEIESFDPEHPETFQSLFARAARLSRALAREMNSIADGEFSHSYDWIGIDTEDYLVIMDQDIATLPTLLPFQVGKSIRKLISDLEEGLTQSRRSLATK
ncbi:MAG: hypothetical protein GYB50_26875 [Rhodobacteraceae bacterium]|nr:hypothetical protein [Paracoccaceae bacterium]